MLHDVEWYLTYSILALLSLFDFVVSRKVKVPLSLFQVFISFSYRLLYGDSLFIHQDPFAQTTGYREIETTEYIHRSGVVFIYLIDEGFLWIPNYLLSSQLGSQQTISTLYDKFTTSCIQYTELVTKEDTPPSPSLIAASLTAPKETRPPASAVGAQAGASSLPSASASRDSSPTTQRSSSPLLPPVTSNSSPLLLSLMPNEEIEEQETETDSELIEPLDTNLILYYSVFAGVEIPLPLRSDLYIIE